MSDVLDPFLLSAHSAQRSKSDPCGNWVFTLSVRARLPLEIRSKSTVFHVKPPATVQSLDAQTPASSQDRDRATNHPLPDRNSTSSLGGERDPHPSRHSQAAPVPSRRTQRETHQGTPIPPTNPRPHTLDVSLSTDLVHISTSIIADRLCGPRNPPAHTLVYVYNGGVRSPLLARVSLTPHTGLHSRTVLQAPSVGPIYSGKSEQYTTPLTSALAHADDRPATYPSAVPRLELRSRSHSLHVTDRVLV